MNIIQTETQTVHTANGVLRLRYRLFSEEFRETGREYGTSITSLDTGEERTVSALTCDEARARVFFARLVRGSVTPVSLMDLAEDFILE